MAATSASLSLEQLDHHIKPAIKQVYPNGKPYTSVAAILVCGNVDGISNPESYLAVEKLQQVFTRKYHFDCHRVSLSDQESLTKELSDVCQASGENSLVISYSCGAAESAGDGTTFLK